MTFKTSSLEEIIIIKPNSLGGVAVGVNKSHVPLGGVVSVALAPQTFQDDNFFKSKD